MSSQRALSRRSFLQIGVGAAGLGLLAACAPTAPTAAPTTAPQKPAAAGAAPTAAPTTAAPAATTAPAAAKADEKLGSSLIGKLEGPTVITDPAQFPKTFKEAPELAELVKAGKLPPVAERIGQDPLVIKPVHEIGKYGGTWRRGFTGPGDKFNGLRSAGVDSLTHWNYDGSKVVPNTARGWEVQDGGRTTLVLLRRGMKWSDGRPFTADDIMFWYEDMYQNRNLYPAPLVQMTVNGKPVVIEKRDEYTVAFRSEDPYTVLPQVLAGQNGLAGHALYSAVFSGPVAPAHYLKQFLPKYTPQEQLDEAAKASGFDNWAAQFRFKNDWALNPELPVLTAWKTVSPANTPTWVLERNPYSVWVDTEGNQLPYIDKVQLTLAENLEILNLRAIAGEYDWQERHVDLAKLPVFLENRQKGNYTVHLDPAYFGSDAAININQSYEADPEVAKWLSNRDFRIAMSLGIDRDQLNETFWLGMGTPGSYAPGESEIQSPGPEHRTLNHTLDIKRANELLDQIGLGKKDSEGFRLRTDGQGRLRVEMMTQAGTFAPVTKMGEMIADQWKKIGLQGDVKEVERSFSERRIQSNDFHTYIRASDGSQEVFTHEPSAMFPSYPRSALGPLYGLWFASNGEQGKEPPPRMKEMMAMYRRAFTVPEDEANRLVREAWKICVEEMFAIGTVGLSPMIQGVRIAKTNIGNNPSRLSNDGARNSPCGMSCLPTLFFRS
jgi:peptide/nickel transport system substrate-binding protein